MSENKVKEKEDRRVRRTKRILVQSLMQLMQEKQLKDITVRELADVADVNRGTFYLYYRDVFDMLEKVENEMFEKFEAILEAHLEENMIQQTLPFLKDLYAFAEENQDMCRVLMSKNGDISFLQKLNQIVFERCREECFSLIECATEEEFESRYHFAVFGCIGMIYSWVNNGCKPDADYMANITNTMITRGVLFQQ